MTMCVSVPSFLSLTIIKICEINAHFESLINNNKTDAIANLRKSLAEVNSSKNVISCPQITYSMNNLSIIYNLSAIYQITITKGKLTKI